MKVTIMFLEKKMLKIIDINIEIPTRVRSPLSFSRSIFTHKNIQAHTNSSDNDKNIKFCLIGKYFTSELPNTVFKLIGFY